MVIALEKAHSHDMLQLTNLLTAAFGEGYLASGWFTSLVYDVG
jgi:hypothetical protein